ncbi:MAG: DEAD/DEAH box helicase [Nitrosopumilus sp.]|nr:DEAD/DEAH box helicase [Nitrosopumilus sp.]
MKTKPYKHQTEALELSKDKQVFALFAEQGTGKTKITIDTIEYLYNSNKINSVVIIAPNGVNRAWLDEQIPLHFGIDEYHHHLWTGKRTQRALESWTMFEGVAATHIKILSIHIDAVITKHGYQAIEKFLKNHNSLLVLDESHKIKNPKALRTKKIIALGKLAQYKRILTGTPVTQNIGDLYSQFAFMDIDIFGHKSYFTFYRRYMNETVGYGPGGRTFTKFDGIRNKEELFDIMKPYSYRVLKKDCLDLPDKVYKTIYVELDGKQRTLYDTLKTEFMIAIDNNEITAATALTRLAKMQQIIGGFVHDTENNISHKICDTPIPRLEVIQDIIEGEAQESKIIIWAKYRYEIKLIVEYLISAGHNRRSILEYHGGINRDIRAENLIAFQNDAENKHKFFISTAQTGGTGLNLTSANTVIYYSNSFSLEARSQSEDRCHRAGQVNKVTYYDIQAINTVDKHIIDILRNKQDIADMVTSNVQRFLHD